MGSQPNMHPKSQPWRPGLGLSDTEDINMFNNARKASLRDLPSITDGMACSFQETESQSPQGQHHLPTKYEVDGGMNGAKARQNQKSWHKI